MEDAIVEEVRKIREEHAARFHYDVDAIFDEFKRLEISAISLASLQPRQVISSVEGVEK